MRPRRITFAFAVIASLAAVACGSTPAPKELVDARSAYTKAQSGPANTNGPARVHEAKESLDIAEKAFESDPSAQETKDRAYVAQRVAQLAEAQGRLAQAEEERNK